ncbi:MAG: hypothetical protein N4A53_02345 [Pelagimonas sp.]|jgi:hypothetical protein|nr:hypothetical protein [Pelagimonas sp.]
MQAQDITYAGLILPDIRQMDPAPYLQEVAQACTQLDTPGKGGVQVDHRRGEVRSAHLVLRIRAEENSPFGPRILIRVLARPGQTPDFRRACAVLRRAVTLALHWSHADIIEWGDPSYLVDATAFHTHLGASIPLVPVSSAEDPFSAYDQRMSTLYADEAPLPLASPSAVARLRARLQDRPADELRLSAAGWVMSAVLAFVALPVAAMLWVIALRRGMDFRLSAQALVVTMLFVSLPNHSALPSMVRLILPSALT